MLRKIGLLGIALAAMMLPAQAADNYPHTLWDQFKSNQSRALHRGFEALHINLCPVLIQTLVPQLKCLILSNSLMQLILQMF